MILLAGFAFLSGIITILSPCILPVLPIILSGSVGGRLKPYGVILGFIGSFSIVTLAFAAVVQSLQIPPDVLRYIAVVMIGLIGLSMILPAAHRLIERVTARISSKTPQGNREGFFGGILLGSSLGIVWTPCVGPILAAVITLAATSSISAVAVVITISYAIGNAVPMLLIMIGGSRLLTQRQFIQKYGQRIHQVFGVVLILTALAMLFGADRAFQTWILETFPDYAEHLTSLESTEFVRQQVKESLR